MNSGREDLVKPPQGAPRALTVTKTNTGGNVKNTKGMNEGLLRNSAKSPRKFATRGTSFSFIPASPLGMNVEVTENRRCDCLPTTQVYAEVERRRMWADACPVLDPERRKWKLLTERQVNGRGNLDRAKVA